MTKKNVNEGEKQLWQARVQKKLTENVKFNAKKMKFHVKCETAVFNAPHKSRNAWPILPTSLYALVHPRSHGVEPVTPRRHAHAKTTIRKRTAGVLQ